VTDGASGRLNVTRAAGASSPNSLKRSASPAIGSAGVSRTALTRAAIRSDGTAPPGGSITSHCSPLRRARTVRSPTSMRTESIVGWDGSRAGASTDAVGCGGPGWETAK
jgi:hypothetical protein